MKKHLLNIALIVATWSMTSFIVESVNSFLPFKFLPELEGSHSLIIFLISIISIYLLSSFVDLSMMIKQHANRIMFVICITIAATSIMREFDLLTSYSVKHDLIRYNELNQRRLITLLLSPFSCSFVFYGRMRIDPVAIRDNPIMLAISIIFCASTLFVIPFGFHSIFVYIAQEARLSYMLNLACLFLLIYPLVKNKLSKS